MDDNKPKVSNTEWGLVIGALFTMDAVQLGLIAFGIGLFINEFIDIFVTMWFGFWLLIRKQIDWSRFLILIAGWMGEAGSDGAIPLWGLEGIVMYMMSKTEKVLDEIPGGKSIGKIVEKK